MEDVKEYWLHAAVQASRHTGQTILWVRNDGEPQDLTNNTGLSGVIRDPRSGAERAILGQLTPQNPLTDGAFTWGYAEADVEEAGLFVVQITAQYNDAKPDSTFSAFWRVWRNHAEE